MNKGYWIPILHSHLPFVKHPEYEYFLEEHWLFEAITGSYIPLLMKMKKLSDEKIDFRMTVSLTPTLLEMLSDEYLMGQYVKYLDKLIELSKKEKQRLKNKDYSRLSVFYHKRFTEIRSFFRKYLKCNVLNGYRHFSSTGNLELITCCATHGFLPLLNNNPISVEAQIRVAADSHFRHFGKLPAGIWLPECAYYKGLDEVLKKYGIRFFFLDSQGLLNGKPAPRYGVYAPVYTINGVAVFGRDPLSSSQVWSATEGYPGDPDYRDFYRDIGFDLDFEYISPYISPDGVRVFTGIKYYRVTGRTDQKQPYQPEKAMEKVSEHAMHFYSSIQGNIESLNFLMDRVPAVTSPYDAELFGHWWFEGPDFLYQVFREIYRKKAIRAVTPSEYLALYPQNQVISPSPGSWGDKGYYEVWLNKENDWIYRHLHYMADTLEKLAEDYYDESDPVNIRVLNQLGRELLLAQSSDWAFLMTTRTAREYSAKRTREHISNFNRLLEGLQTDSTDISFLEWIEYKDSIFSELDFRIYSGRGSGLSGQAGQ